MSIRIDYLDPTKTRPQVCWQLNERLAILYGYTHRDKIKITRCRCDQSLRDLTAKILDGIESYEANQAAAAAKREVEHEAMEGLAGFGSF